jgi:hypothetical protein
MAGVSVDLVDWHCIHLDQGYEAFHRNDFETALVEFDMALAIDERPMARWDRANVLLALGRWREGFKDWRTNWQLFNAEITERGRRLYFDQHRPRWKGEPGARVTILGEAGFGDMIQMLRFVPLARERADIELDLPPPMWAFGRQLAPLAIDDECDCICPMFDLMPALGIDDIPPPPYLAAPIGGNWSGFTKRRKIGICWSTKMDESVSGHPNARRPIPLDQFLALLNPPPDCELWSLQTQERKEAMAKGIHAPRYQDFADVAAVAIQCDTIVSIDSAALHVAGAIAHRNVFGILPFAATWRWLGRSAESAETPWYPGIKLCKQTSPGDWASAFAKVKL